MALDFPDSPTNGQYYEGFTWDSTYSVWRVRAGFEGRAGISSTTGSAGTATTGEAYIFTGSGAITVSKAGLLDVLIVGGGGGAFNAGGGGAGGYFEDTVWFEAGTYTVTVGAGGATGYQQTVSSGSGPRDGFNGIASSVGIYTSPGGGGGATLRSNPSSSNNYLSGAGRTGGSGGGGGNTNYSSTADTVGKGIVGFGNDGGQGGFLTGGGGGGAGGAGSNGGVNYPDGPPAGVGAITTIISTTDATSFSVGQVSGGNVYFAGGGGGGPYTGSYGAGGLGGGGSNSAGTANTGGGGSNNAGGSGCVIVRVS